MGITIDFLIKHVRPIGSGYEQYCNNQMIHCLVDQLHFSHHDVMQIFANWKAVSEMDPVSNSDAFAAAAKDVAMARWGELYPTNQSTLMFLDAAQLASLSQAASAAGANANFSWNAPKPLAICVTINANGGTHILWDAAGCDASTDANGNVVHFRGIRT